MTLVSIVGSACSGKSVLIKYLTQDVTSEDFQLNLFKTKPTIGINLVDLNDNFVEKTTSETVLQLRELGGSLAQNWNSYLTAESSGCTRLVYVIDVTNLQVISEVAIHFINLVQTISTLHSSTKSKVLIAFSKIDCLSKQLLQKNLKTFR